MLDYSRFVVVFELVILIGIIISSIISIFTTYKWIKQRTYDMAKKSVINILFLIFFVFFKMSREVSDNLFPVTLLIYISLFLAPLSLFNKYPRKFDLVNIMLALLYFFLLIGNIKPLYTIQYHKIMRLQSITEIEFSITVLSVLLQSFIIYWYIRKDLTINKFLSWLFLISYQLLHSYYSLSDYPNYSFSLILFPLLYYLIYASNYMGNLGENKFFKER